MSRVQNPKRKLLRFLALAILDQPIAEKWLRELCSHAFIRNHFKLRAIALFYPEVLEHPVARIAEVSGYKLLVNIADYLGMYLYFFKEHFEPFATQLATELIRPGDSCMDVGANMGSYTFLMASRVGASGKVFALEPQPYLHRMIQESIALNHASAFVIADCRAAYSTSGERLKFYIPPNPHISSAAASLLPYGDFLSEDHFIQVETVSLHDYFEEVGVERCKLIKIDVEKAELEVVKGMQGILTQQRVDYVILEQTAHGEAQGLFECAGYGVWLIDERHRRLVAGERAPRGHFGNYLLVNPDCRAGFHQRFADFFIL